MEKASDQLTESKSLIAPLGSVIILPEDVSVPISSLSVLYYFEFRLKLILLNTFINLVAHTTRSSYHQSRTKSFLKFFFLITYPFTKLEK